MSNLKMNLQKELRKDMLVSWLQQWAETQRVREQSFLKIIGFVGIVVFGFAYAYRDALKNYDELSLVTTVCEFILSFGSYIIVIIAYNYRRDQIVNAKILEMANVIGDYKIFPKDYDPRNSFIQKNKNSSWVKSLFKNKRFSWIPTFLAPYYFIFPLIQLLLWIIYLKKVKPGFNLSNSDFYSTISAVSFLLTILFSIILPFIYHCRLMKIINRENSFRDITQ